MERYYGQTNTDFFTNKQKSDIWLLQIIFNNMHEIGAWRVHEFHRAIVWA